MSGHIDDAELNMNEPIVSISLGCPAIFLLVGILLLYFILYFYCICILFLICTNTYF